MKKIQTLTDAPSTPACNNKDKFVTVLGKSSQIPFKESIKKEHQSMQEVRIVVIRGGVW